MNDITAWATIGAALIQCVTVPIAIVSFLVFLWQTRLLRKSLETQTQSLEAQSFLAILATDREIRHDVAMGIIRALECKDYETFKAQVSTEHQELIHTSVDFLNSMNHLMEGGYVPERTLLRMYHCSIIDTGKKLLPWYVQGVNQEANSLHLFHNFEMLFENVKKLEEQGIFKDN